MRDGTSLGQPAGWFVGLIEWMGRSLAALPPRALGTVAAAVLAIIVLAFGGILFALPGEASGADGAFALILFNASARADRLATILAVNGASIVDGPMPGGIYRIRIGSARMTAEARRDAMTKLAADRATVNFVANP